MVTAVYFTFSHSTKSSKLIQKTQKMSKVKKRQKVSVQLEEMIDELKRKRKASKKHKSQSKLTGGQLQKKMAAAATTSQHIDFISMILVMDGAVMMEASSDAAGEAQKASHFL